MNVISEGSVLIYTRPDRNVVELTITDKGLVYLLEIADDNGMAIQDVISQALVLLKAAKDEARNGLAIGATKDASKLDVEFTGL